MSVDSDSRPVIGVLGGMGPLAGAWFMRRLVELTPAVHDQDHAAAILVNDPAVPDRVAPILGGGESPLPGMIAGIRRLERAGATFVAIACNTAHHWHEALQAATPLPVLHIGDAAVAELVARGLSGPVGLLATRGTLHAQIFQKRLQAAGLDACVPDEAMLAHHVLPVIAAVKAGRMREAAAGCRAAAKALRDAGAKSLVLACTEISVAWPEDLARDITVDANDALACAALRAAGRIPELTGFAAGP